MKQHDLFEARGYEERCILCTLFHAVGRGGEVSTATWDNAYWNEELQHFSLHWGEYKNGQQYEMTFHPDMYSWELDWFHAMACFLLCGEGGHKASLASEGDGINWMFPNYVDMAEGGAAAKCSRVLAKCKAGLVEGIPADTSSHGVRVTATDAMLQNHLLQFFSAIVRGGWNFSHDSVFFQYPTQKLHTIAAGKVLAKWPNPNMHVTAPTLNAVPSVDGQQDKVRELGTELFSHCSVAILLAGKLLRFREVMLATVIMYYDDVTHWKDGLPVDNLLVTLLHTACVRCNIDCERLPQWCKCIKDQFYIDNAKNFVSAPGEDANEKSIAIFQNMVQTLIGKVDVLEANVAEMKDDMKSVVGMLRQLCVTGANPTSTPPRPQKQARQSQDVDVAGAGASAPTTSEVLRLGQILHVPANFAQMSKWSCLTFVMEVVKGRADVNTTNWYNGTVDKKVAAKGKAVYMLLETLASKDEKKYFVSTRCPNTGKEREEWLAAIGTIVPRIANEMITHLLKRRLIAAGTAVTENAIQSKRSKQQTGVAALGGLIERVVTAENKKMKL